MLKPIVVDVALKPTTEPSSISLPVVIDDAPFQIVLNPLVPLPLIPPLAAKVICPGVVVVIVMLDPATKLVGAYLVPVLAAASNCPVTVGAVLVPVLPFPAPNTPLIAADPRLIAPLKRFPAEVDLT